MCSVDSSEKNTTLDVLKLNCLPLSPMCWTKVKRFSFYFSFFSPFLPNQQKKYTKNQTQNGEQSSWNLLRNGRSVAMSSILNNYSIVIFRFFQSASFFWAECGEIEPELDAPHCLVHQKPQTSYLLTHIAHHELHRQQRWCACESSHSTLTQTRFGFQFFLYASSVDPRIAVFVSFKFSSTLSALSMHGWKIVWTGA